MIGVKHIIFQNPEILEREIRRNDNVVGRDIPQRRLHTVFFRAIGNSKAGFVDFPGNSQYNTEVRREISLRRAVQTTQMWVLA